MFNLRAGVSCFAFDPGNPSVIYAGNAVQTDWVRSGSSYLSQSMLWQHFGLGRAARADWVEVTWTNGQRQRLENVRANQRVVIEESEQKSTVTRQEARERARARTWRAGS